MRSVGRYGDRNEVYRFSMTSLDIGANVPSSVAMILRGGVPGRMIIGGYEVRRCASRCGKDLEYVAFGTSDMDGSVCIKIDSKEIFFMADDIHEPLFVNSSLVHFSACVEVVVKRFPFYSELDSSEEHALVAEGLEELVEKIDPALRKIQSYWFEAFSDISIGDYSTEDVEAEFGPLMKGSD